MYSFFVFQLVVPHDTNFLPRVRILRVGIQEITPLFSMRRILQVHKTVRLGHVVKLGGDIDRWSKYHIRLLEDPASRAEFLQGFPPIPRLIQIWLAHPSTWLDLTIRESGGICLEAGLSEIDAVQFQCCD